MSLAKTFLFLDLLIFIPVHNSNVIGMNKYHDCFAIRPVQSFHKDQSVKLESKTLG